MAPALSKKQAEEFFKQCDTSGDGKVTVHELSRVICDKYGCSSEDCASMFCDLDKDGDSSLTLSEFLDDVCAPKRSDAIDAFFTKADKDGSGSLTLDEMLEATKDGPLNDVETIKMAFAAADTDGSGKVDLCEFRKSMEKHY